MKKFNFISASCLLSLAVIWLSITCSPAGGREGKGQIPSSYGYEIVNIYPHDPVAFTQGLCYADGLLYEGTGLHSQSRLIRRTLAGEDLEVRRLPRHFFGEGVTVFRDRVIQLTWKARTGIVWNRKDLTFLRVFTYPTEGWGLTHDGRRLIMSDGTATLYFLDPESFRLKRKVAVYDSHGPVARLNELEYIKGEIWANVWKDTRVARIDPKTGRVSKWIDFSELVRTNAPAGVDNVLNGIAYDQEKDRIFITGKRWDKIFEVRALE